MQHHIIESNESFVELIKVAIACHFLSETVCLPLRVDLYFSEYICYISKKELLYIWLFSPFYCSIENHFADQDYIR